MKVNLEFCHIRKAKHSIFGHIEHQHTNVEKSEGSSKSEKSENTFSVCGQEKIKSISTPLIVSCLLTRPAVLLFFGKGGWRTNG